jgi:hypothetical protein
MYKHFQFKCPYCRSWLFEWIGLNIYVIELI